MSVSHRSALGIGFLLALAACSSGASNAAGGAGGASASGGASAAGGTAQVGAGGLNLNVSPGVCPDAGTPRPDAGACTPLQTRSFSRDIAPLFDSCAGEVCHSFAAGAIAQQVGVPSVECCGQLQMIEPGHPERSYVLRKLRGESLCGGERMPLQQPPFNASDLQTISDWICQGAGTSP